MNARDLAARRWKPRSRRARWVFGISVFAIASSAALFALSSVMWYKLDIEQGDEHGWSLFLTDGCIYVGRYQVTWCLESAPPEKDVDIPPISGFSQEMEAQWPPTVVWLPDFSRYRLMVPLWTPSALGALPAFFTRPRRLKPGQCPCGYSLTGLSTYACPECGTPVSPVPSPSTPSADAPSDPRKEVAP